MNIIISFLIFFSIVCICLFVYITIESICETRKIIKENEIELKKLELKVEIEKNKRFSIFHNKEKLKNGSISNRNKTSKK